MLSLIICIILLITRCDKNKDVIGMNEIEKDLWTEIAHFGDDIPTKLAFSEDGYIFVGGSDIYRSKTDSVSFQKVFALGAGRVNDFLTLPNGKILISTENMGLYQSEDNGINWQMIVEWAYYYGIGMQQSGFIFIGGERTVMKLDTSFQILNNILIPHTPAGLYKSVKVNSQDFVLVSCEPGALYLSMNDGTSWGKISLALDTLLQSTLWLHDDYTLAVDSEDNIFLATPRGVYMTSDLGGHWSCLGLDSIYVTSLACDSKGNIYAAAFGDNYIQINGGEPKGIFFYQKENQTWIDISSNLRRINAHGLTVSPTDEPYIFTPEAKLYKLQQPLL